jgi:hypothetical protein
MMAQKKDVLDQLTSVSDRLSTQVRTVALGILALTWGLLVGDSTAAKDISSHWRGNLVALGGLAVLVMFLDFLQYVAGYYNVRALQKKMEKEGLAEVRFDDTSWSWKLRLFFFYAKQWALAINVTWLLIVLSLWLLN